MSAVAYSWPRLCPDCNSPARASSLQFSHAIRDTRTSAASFSHAGRQRSVSTVSAARAHQAPTAVRITTHSSTNTISHEALQPTLQQHTPSPQAHVGSPPPAPSVQQYATGVSPAAGSTSASTLPQPSMTVKAARDFFRRLSTYRPQQPVERRWQLPQACPYSPALFQQAADAACAEPKAVLGHLSEQQLAFIAAGYAAAQHPHPGLQEALGNALSEAVSNRATAVATLVSTMGAGAGQRRTEGGKPTGVGKTMHKRQQEVERVAKDPQPLTLHSAGAMAAAYARFGIRHPALFRALSAWLKGTIRAGALRPKAKAQGLWLSVLLWSFAQLRMYDQRMWEQVSQLLLGAPKWMVYLDANDVLRLVWACSRVQHADPALMHALQLRATTQVGKLSMQDLGLAWSTLASIGYTHPDLLAALTKAVRAKANSLPPPVLTLVLSALATFKLTDARRQCEQQQLRPQQRGRPEEVSEAWRTCCLCLSEKILLELLDDLAIWTANKMFNFQPAEAAAALQAMACLRYRNPWALGKICKVLVHPNRNLLGRMTSLQVLAVLQALITLQFGSPDVAKVTKHLVVQRSGGTPPVISSPSSAQVLQGPRQPLMNPGGQGVNQQLLVASRQFTQLSASV